jgi:hypothetical protein
MVAHSLTDSNRKVGVGVAFRLEWLAFGDGMERGILSILLLGLCPSIWGQTAEFRVCRNIDDALERVTCYDAIVDSAQESSIRHATTQELTVVVTEAKATSSVSERTETPTQEIDPEDIFGRDEQSIRETLEIEKIDEIIQRVTELSKTSSGRLVVKLNNGQIWLQTDTRGLNLKTGDEVKIRAGTMGSHFLTKTSSKRSLRVKRVD